jgi:hypothetical protein
MEVIIRVLCSFTTDLLLSSKGHYKVVWRIFSRVPRRQNVTDGLPDHRTQKQQFRFLKPRVITDFVSWKDNKQTNNIKRDIPLFWSQFPSYITEGAMCVLSPLVIIRRETKYAQSLLFCLFCLLFPGVPQPFLFNDCISRTVERLRCPCPELTREKYN